VETIALGLEVGFVYVKTERAQGTHEPGGNPGDERGFVHVANVFIRKG
jgi:hypothetical protein